MNARLLASDLGFPEGPVVCANGRLVFCDGNIGELSTYVDDTVSTFAVTGGSPWGAVLGSDGAVYVTQGGNVPGSGDTSAISGIQRVRSDGTVELLHSEVDGRTLFGPNDLAFGPDGRLWFTDSGSEHDDRFDVRSPGRLFAVDRSGGGEMVLELPDVYPNGIGFDPQKRLYWTESMAHRVCRLEAVAPHDATRLVGAGPVGQGGRLPVVPQGGLVGGASGVRLHRAGGREGLGGALCVRGAGWEQLGHVDLASGRVLELLRESVPPARP